MADTNAQPVNNAGENSQGSEGRTFTQEQVNGLVEERLARERAKYADYDDLKARADKYTELEEANKTELQKAQEKNEKLKAELDGMKHAAEVQTVRNKVAAETGVPAGLLAGDDEESCRKQAEGILAFAKPEKYPGVKGGKRTHGSAVQTPEDEAFRDFAHQIFGTKE